LTIGYRVLPHGYQSPMRASGIKLCEKSIEKILVFRSLLAGACGPAATSMLVRLYERAQHGIHT
jgi:hypothetical protein